MKNGRPLPRVTTLKTVADSPLLSLTTTGQTATRNLVHTVIGVPGALAVWQPSKKSASKKPKLRQRK